MNLARGLGQRGQGLLAYASTQIRLHTLQELLTRSKSTPNNTDMLPRYPNQMLKRPEGTQNTTEALPIPLRAPTARVSAGAATRGPCYRTCGAPPLA